VTDQLKNKRADYTELRDFLVAFCSRAKYKYISSSIVLDGTMVGWTVILNIILKSNNNNNNNNKNNNKICRVPYVKLERQKIFKSRYKATEK